LPVQNFGNPDLDVERATAFSAGFQWSPIDWLALVFDYWQYDYQDRIDRENATQAVSRFLADGDDPHVVLAEGCNGPPSQCIERIEVTTINTGDLFTNGIDATVMFSFDGESFGGAADDFGRFSFGAVGTYTLSYQIPQESIAPLTTPDGEVIRVEDGNPVAVPTTMPSELPLFLPDGCDGEQCDISGRVNTTNFSGSVPILRVNFPVTWSLSGHAASVNVHYLDSVENDARATDQGEFEVLDSMITVDLQYGYTLRDVIGEATTVRLGVINVFEAEPPITPNDLDGLSSLHDPRGRMFYAKLIQEF
jgi:outer membrane receptor protein involved in Fe transport